MAGLTDQGQGDDTQGQLNTARVDRALLVTTDTIKWGSHAVNPMGSAVCMFVFSSAPAYTPAGLAFNVSYRNIHIAQQTVEHRCFFTMLDSFVAL